MTQNTRPRGKRIDVWVTEDELRAIDENAALVRQSRSSFLRNLGMGYQPASTFDREAIREMVKLHADQGRLGGLLKLWLSEKPAEGAKMSSVRNVLHQIESLQQQLAKLVMREKSRL